VIHPDPIVIDRFNREEFEANPDSSDSSDSDNEISTPPHAEQNNHVTDHDEHSNSDSENDDSKNSTPNHVLAMLNRVQGLDNSRDSEYDSEQSRDEDSPLTTPRSDALIRFSRMRKIVANTPQSVHVKTKHGATPLLAAVLVDDVQAVKLFLAHKADPDAIDHEGRSAVWWAARLGLGDVLRALLEHGATLHTRLTPPVLHIAVLSQQLSAVTALLSHKSVVLAALDVKGRSALHYAAALPNTDILNALIDRGIDLLSRDQQEMTAVFYAALYGPVKHVKLLVREVMLQTWHQFRATKKIKLHEFPLNTLLSLAYDPVDNRGTTPLFWAAWAGRTSVVSALLSEEISTSPSSRPHVIPLSDMRARDLQGRTVLHVTVAGLHHALTHRMLSRARGVVDCLALLLNIGADPRAVDHYDSTALHVLSNVPIRFGEGDTRATLIVHAAELLLAAGTPLAKQNRKGMTALQLMAQSGCAALVDHVLTHCHERHPWLFLDAQHRSLLHHVLLGLKRYPAAINSDSALQCVKVLLNKETSSDKLLKKDKLHRLPLHLAARLGAAAIVRLLLAHAPETATMTDAHGRIALQLFLASPAHSAETLKLFLEQKSSLTARDKNGWTALHWLAHGSRPAEYYNVLAEHLPDEHHFMDLLGNPLGRRRSALHVAARAGNKSFMNWALTRVNEDAAKKLLQTLDQGHNTPLHTALRAKSSAEQFDLVRDLVRIKSSLVHEKNSSGITPLHIAVRWNNAELVNLLLDLGADPNAPDDKHATPLHESVASHAEHAIRALVDRRADVTCLDHKSRGLIHWLAFSAHDAAYQGTPLLKLFLALSPAPALHQGDHKGRTPLHYLAWHGTHDVTLLKTLWDSMPPQSRDACDLNGQTALHLAAERGHVALVALLLDLGAVPDVVDTRGRTALHVAASHGQVHVIEHVVSADPNLVDVPDLQGRTALIIAAQRGHLEAVKTLLDNQSDKLARDARGRTALHWAAAGGHVGCVAELWSFDLFQISDNTGATALQLAWQQRQHRVFMKLENLLAESYFPKEDEELVDLHGDDDEEEDDEEHHVIFDDDEDTIEPEFDDDDESIGDRSEISVDEGHLEDDDESFSAEELTPVTAHPSTPLTAIEVQPEIAAVARVLYTDELELNLAHVKSPRSPRSPRVVGRVIPLPSPTAPRSPRYTSLTRSVEELTNRVRAHNASAARAQESLRDEVSGAAFNHLVKLTASLLRARLMTLESHLVLQDSRSRLDKLTREHREMTRVKVTLDIERETLQAMESGKTRVLARVSSVSHVLRDDSYKLNHVLTTVLMITCCLLGLLLYSEHARQYSHVI
jgi:ankyrin repeat protein